MPASVAFDAPSRVDAGVDRRRVRGSVERRDTGAGHRPARAVGHPRLERGRGDLDGSVVLGMTAADETVLYDLADGSTTVLRGRRGSRPGDLGGDSRLAPSPVTTRSPDPRSCTSWPRGRCGQSPSTTGGVVSAASRPTGASSWRTRALTNGEIQAAWVYHLDSGKLDKLRPPRGLRPRAGSLTSARAGWPGRSGRRRREGVGLQPRDAAMRRCCTRCSVGHRAGSTTSTATSSSVRIQTCEAVGQPGGRVRPRLGRRRQPVERARWGIDGLRRGRVDRRRRGGVVRAFVYDHRTPVRSTCCRAAAGRESSAVTLSWRQGRRFVVVWDIASLR